MSELIAEARVLIRPDTTKFRTELVAEVNAATKAAETAVKPVVVPVSTVFAGASRAAQGTAQEIAGATAAQTKLQAQQERFIVQRRAAERAASEQRIADGQKTVAALVAEERKLIAQKDSALIAVRSAERAASEARIAEKQREVAALLAADRKEQASALAAAETEAARAAAQSQAASAAQARNLGQLSRGATSATLSFLGLRGATLAAGGAFLAGAAGVLAFSKAIGSAARLETSLNTFQATAGATADQMQRIESVSKQLGQDLTLPGVSAQDAADSLAELSKAGLSVEDSLGGVRGVLQLSTAASISTAQSVELVANALNAFSLAGKEASTVADLLAASSKESQGSILDVGLALQQSAAAAAEAGVSVQDTIALLTELQRAGIRGSDAGTSLRTALLRLINPTEKAKTILDGLNVTLRDQKGNIRPEVFGELTEQLNKFGTAQRQAALATLFGADAFRAASIFGREGVRGLNETRAATQEVGVAQDLASARTKGLAGSLENLKNQLQTLGTGLGQAASGPAQDFLDFLSEGVKNINEFGKFLGKLGQDTPTAAKSISELADEFARLNKESGGTGSQAAAAKRVEDLGRPAAIAVLKYAALTKELGRMSDAFATLKAQGNSLDTPGAKALAEHVEELTQALEDSVPAGLKAASTIEDYRSSLTAAALELQKLKNSISPPEGFLPAAPTLAVRGPTPVGPTAKLSAAEQVAQARGDLQEVLRLQQIRLANAKKEQAAAEKVANVSKASLERRTKAVQEVGAAEAAVIQTQQQITQQNLSAATTAAQKAKQAQAVAETAFLGRQSDARQRQQNRINAAEQTKGVADDIRQQEGLRTLIGQQITAIRNSRLSEETKRAAILSLNTAKIATIGALQTLRQTQEQEIKQSFGKRVTLAELQAQLTGNDTVLVRAINAYVKYLRTVALPAAKKARQGVLDVKIEIDRLLLERKNLAKDAGESPDVFAARLFEQAADQFRRFGSNISGARTGLLSPQDARGQFAANLLGPTGQLQAVGARQPPSPGDIAAGRQRDSQLAESKKQTALLQVIARGPRREIRGVTVPKATQETVANIAANVLRGL